MTFEPPSTSVKSIDKASVVYVIDDNESMRVPLPAHPHEGAVVAPDDEPARVIAQGTSKVTGRRFNLAVAFESSDLGGPAIAQSTFRHFADYNWDARLGWPSFVTEFPGNGMQTERQALRDTHRYAVNVALWLAGAV